MQDPGADLPTRVNGDLSEPPAPEGPVVAPTAPSSEATVAPTIGAPVMAPTVPIVEPSSPVLTRDALVFVPSMTRSWSEKSLHAVATDIALSLNTLSQGLRFTVGPGTGPAARAGSGPSTYDVVTISRATFGPNEAQQTPVIDLYGLEYEAQLVAAEGSDSVLIRALKVLFAIVLGGNRLVRILTASHHSKTLPERLQMVYALGILVLYAVFLAFLFASIVQVAAQTLQAVLPSPDIPVVPGATASPGVVVPPTETDRIAPLLDAASGTLPTWLFTPLVALHAFWDSTLARVIHLSSLVSALVWLILPPGSRLKQFFTNGATDVLAIDYYLRQGTGAASLQGSLTGLIDALRDNTAMPYRQIHLLSYSFGSILSINALFPHGSPLPPRSPMRSIHSLVTIGCPFDMVRMARPGYFRKRQAAPGLLPGGWLNVYAPADILGSNFRSDRTLAQPSESVWSEATAGGMPMPENRAYFPGGAPQDSNALSALVLTGFKVHRQYWDAGESGESSSFDLVIDYLYAEDPILSR